MAQQTIKLSTPRDIGIAVNNALLIASRPDGFPISEKRLRRLSEYTAALVAPCQEHVDDGLLDYRELVVCLLSCALLVNTANYTGGDKLPLVNLAKQAQKREKVD